MSLPPTKFIPHSQPWVLPEDAEGIASLLSSASLSKGEKMREFEGALASYLNKKHALFTGNGTQALQLILSALKIGKGDEVIMPTYVCDKVWKGIAATGATPVLCDVNEFGVMDENTVFPKISPKTKAMVLVHIFGINAWNPAWKKLAFPVIEDICQSFGHEIAALKTGIHSPYAFTSFHGTKSLALGEGGMLFSDNSEIFDEAVALKGTWGNITSGTEIMGVLGLNVWKRYPESLRRRNAIADRYNREINGDLNSRQKALGSKSMHFRYVLSSAGDWDVIKAAFLERGIHVRKGVDALVHRDQNIPDADFMMAVKNFEQAVSIPILPQLTEEEVGHIIHAVNEIHASGIL